MKKQLLLIGYLVVILSVGCNDKYQSLFDAAPKPVLIFSKDTLSIREKDYSNINQTNNGKLYLHSAFDNHQLNIQITDTSGKLNFEYNGLRLQTYQPLIVAGDSTAIFCSCDTAGIYGVDFYITDQLGKTTGQQLIVNCLANQKAKASLSLLLIDSTQAENWIYKFDASASKKMDGIITAYHYMINDQPVTTTMPVMNWSFHTRGLQVISLFITDDLKKNSDAVHTKILIQ